MNYIKNLNGLRAIAVISVLLYHFDFHVVTGGFVGVDVFLVISGFLITLILMREKTIEKGIFVFWKRRLYRLLPAMIAVVFSTLLVGFALFSPDLFTAVAKSSIASILFYSNIYNWSVIDYFAADTVTMPLLHFWSLALEMQFYICWSLLFFSIKGLDIKKKHIILIIIFLTSLVLSVLYSTEEMGAYYLLPSRLFEFTIGSFCAFFVLYKKTMVSNALFIAAFIGLMLIFFTYSQSISYPGYAAVLPCALTALIILTLDTNAANIVLGNRFMNYTGKISYSLYLVHWPVYVYLYYISQGSVDTTDKIKALVLVFILSALLYTFIEAKFLNKKPISTVQNMVFSLGFIATILLSVTILITDGMSWRLNEGRERVSVDVSADLNRQRSVCKYKEVLGYQICFFGDTSNLGMVDIVFMGDSHAWHLLSGLDNVFTSLGIKGAKINQAGGTLPSVVGDTYTSKGPKPQTRKYFPLLTELKPKAVILSARWGLYANSMGTYGTKVSYQRINGKFENSSKSKESFKYAMSNTLEYINNLSIPIVVIGQIPEYGSPPESCLNKPKYFANYGLGCSGNTIDINDEFSKTERDFFNSKLDIIYVDLFKERCSLLACDYTDDGGRLIYKDGDHIDFDGGIYIAESIIEPAIESFLIKIGVL